MIRRLIGAIRIKGRWVDRQVLERLSRRSQGPMPPSRRQLTDEFCRAVDWRDVQGRLSVSSASVALGRLENPRAEINLASLLAPHQQQTARRMAAESVVLLAQDTTGLSYGSLLQTTGLGMIGEGHTRGLFLHSLQAFRLDGIPLGNVWAQVWARPPESDTAQRNEQSFDEKDAQLEPRLWNCAGKRSKCSHRQWP